jgi:hypothetical protein
MRVAAEMQSFEQEICESSGLFIARPYPKGRGGGAKVFLLREIVNLNDTTL